MMAEIDEADDIEKGSSTNQIDRDIAERLLDSAVFTVPNPVALRPETRDSQVPKMRLSGGLAEMGELSLQDTTQGWPIYWRWRGRIRNRKEEINMRESRIKKAQDLSQRIKRLNWTSRKHESVAKRYVPSAFSPPSQLTGSTKEKTKASPPWS
jgi:hypothetical protein